MLYLNSLFDVFCNLLFENVNIEFFYDLNKFYHMTIFTVTPPPKMVTRRINFSDSVFEFIWF